MIEDNDFISLHASKIGFLFCSFVVIASGFVTQVIPCQTQSILQNGIYAKHLIGFLICFVFIMLGGGWSFNKEEQNKNENTWHNGNAFDSIIFGIGLYFIFLLTSKMKLIPNMILYSLLFCVYVINTQRSYWNNRNMITEKKDKLLYRATIVCVILCIPVFLYGIIDYFLYQKNKHGLDFNLSMFFFSDRQCDSIV